MTFGRPSSLPFGIPEAGPNALFGQFALHLSNRSQHREDHFPEADLISGRLSFDPLTPASTCSSVISHFLT